jgi:hypothetical protein
MDGGRVAQLLGWLAIMGVGIWMMAANGSCATMGSACRNSGSTLLFMGGATAVAIPLCFFAAGVAAERRRQQAKAGRLPARRPARPRQEFRRRYW